MASSSRLDRRAATELRPLSTTFGELDRADGSARFSFGSEAALASLSGPLEVRLREELPDRATFEVVHRPLEGVGATPSRALITSLTAILPPLLGLGAHPRSLVQHIVQSLSPSPSSLTSSYPSSSSSFSQKTWPAPDDDESIVYGNRYAPLSGTYFSTRAAALNASTLAILDAGSISLRAIPIAVACAYIPNRAAKRDAVNGDGGGHGALLVLDPSSEEEGRAISRHVFAWAFGERISTSRQGDGEMEVDGRDAGEAELVWAESEGDFTRVEFENAMEQSLPAAMRVLRFIREKMAEHFTKRL